MKIIQISASYKPAFVYGGPTMSVSQLCEALQRAGINISMLTTLANGKAELDFPTGEEQKIDGVAVRFFKRITKDHSHFSPALLRYFFYLPKNSKDIVVHIHAWWNLVSVLSCLIGRWKKWPVVLSPRGTLSAYSFNHRKVSVKKIMHLFIGKKLLENCHFHFTSEQEEQQVLQIIQPKSNYVIPNFVQFPAAYAPSNHSQNQQLRLLFLSRIDEKKGLDVLFNALRGIKIDYLLTIAGTGNADYMDFLKDLADKNSITAYINWVGFQNQQQKFEIMQQHDLLVLPSHNENFANVVIEALSVGTAVLISNQVGLADYVTKYNFGRTFINEPEKLRQHLDNIFRNRSWLNDVKALAPQQIREDFAASKLVDYYVDFYRNILKSTP